MTRREIMDRYTGQLPGPMWADGRPFTNIMVCVLSSPIFSRSGWDHRGPAYISPVGDAPVDNVWGFDGQALKRHRWPRQRGDAHIKEH